MAALKQMAARDPDRQDILSRIAEIQAEGPSIPGGQSPEPVATPQPLENPPGGLGSEQASRRSGEKQKFEEWINRIRQEGGPST